MQEAWARRPNVEETPEVGSMLRFLADKYAMSFHFQTPQPLSLPRAAIEKAARDPKSLGQAVAKILEAQLKPKAPKVAKPRKLLGRKRTKGATRNRIGPFRESLVTDAVASL
jgi:hypothetical protein